jgi:hypothetical protein
VVFERPTLGLDRNDEMAICEFACDTLLHVWCKPEWPLELSSNCVSFIIPSSVLDDTSWNTQSGLLLQLIWLSENMAWFPRLFLFSCICLLNESTFPCIFLLIRCISPAVFSASITVCLCSMLDKMQFCDWTRLSTPPQLSVAIVKQAHRPFNLCRDVALHSFTNRQI